MKKAAKIANRVFIIGLIVIVLVFIITKVQAYQSETILLPESFHSPETDLGISLFIWCIVYGFARMVLYIRS